MSGKKTGIQEPAPVKRKKTGLIIAILCILLVVAAGIVSTQMHDAARLYGELEWENVRLTVDQKVANSFYVKIANKSSTKMNFGWVDPSTAILQTTKGTYSQKVRKEVPSRTDSFLYLFFPNARGVPQSLSFEAVGKNLGATSSVKMDFSLSGEGENAILPMNPFEMVWAFICWIFYWFISISSFQEIVIRMLVCIVIIVPLKVIIDHAISRKARRARLETRNVQRFSPEPANNSCEEEPAEDLVYFTIFDQEDEVNEKESSPKSEVPDEKSVPKKHRFRTFIIILLNLCVIAAIIFLLMAKDESNGILKAIKNAIGRPTTSISTDVRSIPTPAVRSETEEIVDSWFSDVLTALQKNNTKTLKKLLGEKTAAELKKYQQKYKLGPNEKLSIRVAEKDGEHIYFSLIYGDDPIYKAYSFRGCLTRKKDYWLFECPEKAKEILTNHFCDKCHGDGTIAQTIGGSNTCAICNGTGQQYNPNLYYDAIMGWTGGYTACSGCAGSGRIGGSVEYHLCQTCQGTGLR